MYNESDVPDQSGKTVLITGANTGIGYETARVLAINGARVLIGCRSPEKAQSARQQILDEAPQADVEIVALDLNSLDSIRGAADQVNGEDRLDILINNAGIMIPPLSRTADGFESQFGVNHLGHFALTGLLLPKILTQAEGRVVTVTSLAHKTGKIDFHDIQCDGSYDAMARYRMSKLANALFTRELQRRLTEANAEVISVACHPGIADTELSRDFGAWFQLVAPFFRLFPILNTPLQGALPTLMAATDPSVNGDEIYGPVSMGEVSKSARKVQFARPAKDMEAATNLWRISEELTGVAYPI